MKPYYVGRDLDTKELLIGETGEMRYYLRGSRDDEELIRKLVLAANNWIHQESERWSDVVKS